MAAQSLVFQETQFDVIDHEGQPWLKAADIARALGYAREDSVSRIYDRNSDEFTSAMSQTVNLTVSGKINGLQNLTVRIFSLRGAHLLAMFARTAVAKEFRKWVLDILDREAAVRQSAPSEMEAAVLDALCCTRFILRIDQNYQMSLKEISPSDYIVRPEEFAKIVGDEMAGINVGMLSGIIEAAARRLGGTIK